MDYGDDSGVLLVVLVVILIGFGLLVRRGVGGLAGGAKGSVRWLRWVGLVIVLVVLAALYRQGANTSR